MTMKNFIFLLVINRVLQILINTDEEREIWLLSSFWDAKSTVCAYLISISRSYHEGHYNILPYSLFLIYYIVVLFSDALASRLFTQITSRLFNFLCSENFSERWMKTLRFKVNKKTFGLHDWFY